MAYTTINKSSAHFNTKLYTGNGSQDPGQSITGVGFQPDMAWIKGRSSTDWNDITDAVRGATKSLFTNTTDAQATSTTALKSFLSDGYNLGSNSQVNGNGTTYVGWNWKANGSGSANTNGSINSTVSVNTTSGFSIVKWTGTGSNATIGHGLTVAPAMIIVKELGTANDWVVYHKSLGGGKYIYLNQTTGEASASTVWQNYDPTSSVFYTGTSGLVSQSEPYIAYCFAEKTGYSKFGSYVGNDNDDGTFVYTGFKPSYVMIKKTNADNDWFIQDNKRLGYNAANYYLEANTDLAEQSNSDIDIVSNGFKCRTTGGGHNDGNYIYMAFGQTLVGTNNIPNNAR